jgi:hypothetical protein
VTGWTTWGRQNSNPQFQDPSVLNPRVNYSWIRGRQSFKTGYEYQAINTQIDDFNPKYGRDSYGGQFSRPANAATDPATYNLADFMFGLRNSYALINPFIANLRQRTQELLPRLHRGLWSNGSRLGFTHGSFLSRASPENSRYSSRS